MLNLTLRSQRMVEKDGYRDWEVVTQDVSLPPERAAVIIVDMWDRHWSRGAMERGDALAERINAAAIRAREKGVLIVHAPSDTMAFYAGCPARERLLSVEPAEDGPAAVPVMDYPLPVDDSDGGSDTRDDDPPDTPVWTRQSPKIFIDQDRDVICGDEGDRLYAYLRSRGIDFLIYMGVHTNMCVLDRSFAIKAMLRRGMGTALVRDLTDALYNPARPPYVSHDEGVRLVIEYIEKFYCPTLHSGQL